MNAERVMDTSDGLGAVDQLDFDARYSVAGYDGVAFYLRGYVMEEPGVPWNTDFVRAVMVGDDYEHIVDVNDLTLLEENDYCHECGQIGCGHDGIER